MQIYEKRLKIVLWALYYMLVFPILVQVHFLTILSSGWPDLHVNGKDPRA